MPKRKSEDTEFEAEFVPEIADMPVVEEPVPSPHPLEGKHFHFGGSWWHVQDGKRVYVQSAWDLPSDREVVTVTQEEFDALA